MSAAAAPSREAILGLYHNMMRTSQSFSSYNFRHYFLRRTKEQFRVLQVIYHIHIPSNRRPELGLCFIRLKQTQRELATYTQKP